MNSVTHARHQTMTPTCPNTSLHFLAQSEPIPKLAPVSPKFAIQHGGHLATRSNNSPHTKKSLTGID